MSAAGDVDQDGALELNGFARCARGAERVDRDAAGKLDVRDSAILAVADTHETVGAIGNNDTAAPVGAGSDEFGKLETGPAGRVSAHVREDLRQLGGGSGSVGDIGSGGLGMVRPIFLVACGAIRPIAVAHRPRSVRPSSGRGRLLYGDGCTRVHVPAASGKRRQNSELSVVSWSIGSGSGDCNGIGVKVDAEAGHECRGDVAGDLPSIGNGVGDDDDLAQCAVGSCDDTYASNSDKAADQGFSVLWGGTDGVPTLVIGHLFALW